MPFGLDNYLGIHPEALTVSAQRSELLAANLANADTPNYKARDIDFRAALSAASNGNGGGVTLASSHATHISTHNASSGIDSQTKYRAPLASSLDGNTVDAQVEQANFAENSVRYQATLTFLNSKFRNLITAITGQ